MKNISNNENIDLKNNNVPQSLKINDIIDSEILKIDESNNKNSKNIYETKINRILCVIPCYNEEVTIGSVVIKCKQYVDEVLVIDDGSKDQTSMIARNAGAIVLSHNKNQGKAAGIKTGFRYSIDNDFDYVITLDGDGQHNADEIPQILKKIIKKNEIDENNDIAIGTRYGKDTEMPLYRRFGKRVLDYTTSFGSGGNLTDSQSGFRAFSKKAVNSLTPRLKGNEFSVESEQLILANELGLKTANAHVSCKYQSIGNADATSTKTPTSHGLGVLGYIIWLIAEKRPLLYIGVPGLSFVIFGIYWGIITLQDYNKYHVFPIEYALVTSLFTIVGIIAVFIGLLFNTLPQIIKRIIDEKDTSNIIKYNEN